MSLTVTTSTATGSALIGLLRATGALALLTLSACLSPLVGAECEPGWIACEGRCVDPETDPGHCGACARICAEDEVCDLGSCLFPLDGGEDGSVDAELDAELVDGGPADSAPMDGSSIEGGLPDGGVPDGSVPDGGLPDGGVPDGGLPDGGVPDGGLPDGSVPDGSVPDGSVPDGSVPDGSVPDGSVPDGSVPDGGLPDGSVPDGSVSDGSVPDGSVPDGSVPDGSVPDGSVPDGSVPDGSVPDGSAPDGSAPDGSAPDGGCFCSTAELCCSDTCVDLSSDPLHCGGCDQPCLGSEICSAGSCVFVCGAPTIACEGGCVDPRFDPDHCGACGSPCASGICESGVCVTGEAGHIVVIGHDFRSSRPGMNRIAGNAVFVASGSPVRVVEFVGLADPRSAEGVVRAIEQVAIDRGRSWQSVVASAEVVPLELESAEVFLIHSQHGETDGGLRGLGARWQAALGAFLRRGGVIVLFDGGGLHGGTFQILDEAGKFSATARVDVSMSTLDVVALGDSVALGVPVAYRAERTTVRFETLEPGRVVDHPDGPVVLHRIVSP